MDPILKAWAKRYFFTGIGREETDECNVENSIEEDVLQATYQSEFLQPLSKMVGMETVTPDVIRQALVCFGSAGCTVWPYVLNYWLENGYYDTNADFCNVTVNNCATRFMKELRLLYATTGSAHKDFVVFANKQNKPVGKFPTRVFCYIGVTAHKGGQTLLELSKKPPLSLTNSQRILLCKAVEFKMIQESELVYEEVLLPLPNGEIRKESVCACTHNIPPSEVTSLINAMAPAYVQEFPSCYFALRDYVADKPHEQVIDKYLEQIAEHFNVSSNPQLRLDDSEDESCNFVGTLDDVVKAYCEKENINLDCTIAQLIEYINYDITIEPERHETSAEDVASWIKHSGKFDDDTTALIVDIIENKAEKNVSINDCVDKQSAALAYVNDASNIDPEAKKTISSAIKDGCTPPSAEEQKRYEQAIVEDYIGNLGLPNKLALTLINAVAHADKASIDALFSKPPVQEVLASINLPIGLERAIVTALNESKPVVLPEAYSAKPTLSEAGYVAGEYLLRQTRLSIDKDASFKNREQYTNVLYCFLRLLMGDFKTERDSIKEYLLNYQKKSTPEVANVIAEAIKLI